MNKTKIYMRVDATAKIGMGHMVRCIALAQMLIEEFSICFICKNIPQNTAAEIQRHSIGLKTLEHEKDLINIIAPNSIVVIDHYDLDSDYQKYLKKMGHKVVCIDDLHEKKFYADLIINHAPGLNFEDYDASLSTQFALGPDYVLLRPVFLKSIGRYEVTNECKDFFICFGGSDSRNLTEKCVRILLARNDVRKVSVVVGPLNDSLDSLMLLKKNNSRLTIHSTVDENKMLDLMHQSHVAIVPSSGILLEAHSAGCKIISGMYTENQKFIYSNYKKAKLFIDAGTFTEDKITAAINNCQNTSVSEKVFDGKSGVRLLKIFKNLIQQEDLKFREATVEDLKRTYAWATNTKIRKYAYNPDKISFEEHQLWFLNKISSPENIYLIAEINKEVIGSLRYDFKDNEAIISYLVDPKYHGYGYGLLLLKQGLVKLIEFNIPKVEKVVGFVMKNNVASVRVFNQLGYKVEDDEGKSYKYFKKIKK